MMENIARRIALAATLALAALAIAAPSAHAQTFYNSLAAFNAAATTGTFYNFENIAVPGSAVINPAVLTTPAPGRITFVVTGGSDTSVTAADSAFNGGDYQLSDGTDSVLAGLGSSITLVTTRINLDAFYSAFGIEIGQESNGTSAYTIGLYNNNTQVGTNFISGTVGDIFFGATSGTAFNNVRVLTGTFNSRYTLFDNARTGSVAVVPEASTLALLLPALGAVFCVAKSRIGAVVVRRRK